MLRPAVRAMASLRLTVTLLALSMFLIFAGTLAQVENGIWTVMAAYFRTAIAWIPLQLFIPRQFAEVPLAIPFPGGYLLGGLLMVNLLAAHAHRFKLSWKRTGIILTHLGIIVLLASEFVTGILAEEGLMTIDEGESASYVEDIREAELVFLERIGPDREQVVAVPRSKLIAAARSGKPIRHVVLPFDIYVEEWLPNSKIVRVEEDNEHLVRATEGAGLRWLAVHEPRVSGVDGQVDAPSALISLKRDGESLGKWLVSLHLNPVQSVSVDDPEVGRRNLRPGLRFKRTYKPYTMHLLEFRHDRFVGTERPRNFSSRIRLVDPSRNEDREVLIRMNQPLRYAGETFYQSAYKEGDIGTILQVVRNPGWLLPYIACAMVGLGMLWHFGLRLSGFAGRGRAAPARATSESSAVNSSPPNSPLCLWVPLIASLAAIAVIVAAAWPRSVEDPYQMAEFGAIPVSADGRIKPLDTVARTSLMIISGRQSFAPDGEGERLPAVRWLADVMAASEQARDYRIFRIDHPDVRQLIDAGETRERPYYSISEIMPHWAVITSQAQRAADVPGRQRDPFQRAILGIFRQVMTYMELSQMQAPYMVPPTGPGEEWAPFFRTLHDAMVGGQPNPAVSAITAIMSAYHQQKPEAFVRAVQQYRSTFAEHMPATARKAEFEVFFNRFRPFYLATALYIGAFLLACAALLLRNGMVAPGASAASGSSVSPGATSVVPGPAGPAAAAPAGAGAAVLPPFNAGGAPAGQRWMNWSMALAAAAFWVIVITFVLHTFGLIARMYLQGRPPVTNLYSSAIFVGWGTVLLALILERIYKMALGSLAAASVGAVTLIIAHNLAGDGDTLEMMQAVLDSNFWLSTHVITITIGYSATFLAGFLATVYILFALHPRMKTPAGARLAQSMSKMVYGTVCFALLFSFLGTVLGGIWADQSWGRFWGWDPKENGAALIVLLQAIILHARWGGMIRIRGLMVLAVAGNIITAWAWFGTNMLGVGLHSYGFMESAVFWLMAFVFSQLAIMGLGLLTSPAPGITGRASGAGVR